MNISLSIGMAYTCLTHVCIINYSYHSILSILYFSITFNTVFAWLSGRALVLINVVTLRRARLVLGWVTVWAGKPSRYVTSHLRQLSLPSLRGR